MSSPAEDVRDGKSSSAISSDIYKLGETGINTELKQQVDPVEERLWPNTETEQNRNTITLASLSLTKDLSIFFLPRIDMRLFTDRVVMKQLAKAENEPSLYGRNVCYYTQKPVLAF